MKDHEELVRERAYLLWEQAGRPEDRTLEFWFAAVREYENAEDPEIPSQDDVEPEAPVEPPQTAAAPAAAEPAAAATPAAEPAKPAAKPAAA
jgi:hypothetical protein